MMGRPERNRHIHPIDLGRESQSISSRSFQALRPSQLGSLRAKSKCYRRVDGARGRSKLFGWQVSRWRLGVSDAMCDSYKTFGT